MRPLGTHTFGRSHSRRHSGECSGCSRPSTSQEREIHTEMNRSRPIRTGVSEKPNLRNTSPERKRVVEIGVVDGEVRSEQHDEHFQRIRNQHLPFAPSLHAYSIRVTSLPMSQLVGHHSHNLIIGQLLQQRIVHQDSIHSEEADCCRSPADGSRGSPRRRRARRAGRAAATAPSASSC